jgi:Fe-S cluster assembly protein SufD
VCRLPSSWFPQPSELSCIVESALTSQLLSFRHQALTAYSKLYGTQQDKELARFITFSYAWPFGVPAMPLTYHELGSGIVLVDLAQAYSLYPEIRAFVNDSFSGERSLIELLIQATYTRAAVLFIPAGTITPEPIPIPLLGNQNEVEILFIFVGSGAQVTLYDTVKVSQETINRSIYGLLSSSSQVTLVSNCQLGEKGQAVQHERWVIQDNAFLQAYESLCGGTTIRIKEYALEGEHAQIEQKMVSALKDTDRSVLLSKQVHKGAHSSSSLKLKTALFGESRSFYRGTIDIPQDSYATNAEQYHTTLMMSPHARVCAIPSLEVKAHDVQCRHGSAAGELQQDQLWYLLSRGLDAMQAKELILEVFFKNNIPEHYQEILIPIKAYWRNT